MYTIKAMLKYNDSLATYTLSDGAKWFIASNSVIEFRTISEARAYARTNKIVENRPQLGSDSVPFIRGPRGGRHSIFGDI